MKNKTKPSHPLTTLQEKMREEYRELFLSFPKNNITDGFATDEILDFISQAISIAYSQGWEDGYRKKIVLETKDMGVEIKSVSVTHSH